MSATSNSASTGIAECVLEALQQQPAWISRIMPREDGDVSKGLFLDIIFRSGRSLSFFVRRASDSARRRLRQGNEATKTFVIKLKSLKVVHVRQKLLSTIHAIARKYAFVPTRKALVATSTSQETETCPENTARTVSRSKRQKYRNIPPFRRYR